MSVESIVAEISLGTEVVPQDYFVIQHYPGMTVLYPFKGAVNLVDNVTALLPKMREFLVRRNDLSTKKNKSHELFIYNTKKK